MYSFHEKNVFELLIDRDERRRLEAEHLDLRAPGIERKNSQTNLFSSDSFQTFGGDYEEKKLMANKGNSYKNYKFSKDSFAILLGVTLTKTTIFLKILLQY